ncbi:hypothetical protein HK107_06190 [Parvularcula sp. ZS-1/3]|uniref:Cellulose biosynthesis protein BcsS n=1 Tax=Parvularcula mediterranea TaxID=2732508 RepID=A0A7Y3RLT6_9PROT|nr:hypothetical protein [Parvularcula mediterranea]NNU15911.1 hypothetical protein [Parvularcula mediterranea]
MAFLFALTKGACAEAWRLGDERWLAIDSLEAFSARAEARSFQQVVLRTYRVRQFGDDLSIGGQLASAWQEAAGPGYLNDSTGVSEAELFALFHAPRRGRVALAGRLTTIFGTSKFARGQRVMGQDAAIGIGGIAGVGSEHVFAETDIQYRESFGDDADQVRHNVTTGLKGRAGMVLLQSFNTVSLKSTGSGGTDYDLGQVAFSYVAPLREDWSLQIGARQDVYGRNLDTGTAAFFSIWRRI